MTSGNTTITFLPNSYEQVGIRIQRMVSDPGAQKVQAIKITRREDELPEAWERVLEELSETDGITVERLEGDSARIGWQKYVDL